MLATTCRLIEAGAGVSWFDDEVEVRVGDCTFQAPADCRLLGVSVHGVFLDDTWRFRNLDLDGKTVINVGGHIGIVAVALARKGATVHVFEPFEAFAHYLRKNAAANGVAHRIHVHSVGLSDCTRSVCDDRELSRMASSTHGSTAGISALELVDACDYFEKNEIREIALLQMNCEGCEYAVLTQPVLGRLAPQRIHIEFHEGEQSISDLLKSNGYRIEFCDWGRRKGKLFASR
jgi:FkbM family methyltransferase